MNTNLKIAVAFIAGLFTGGYAINHLVKEKYKAISDEEIASVKQAFSDREKIMKNNFENLKETAEEQKENKKKTKITEKPPIKEYAKILKKEGYTDYSRTSVPKSTPELDRDPRDDPDVVFEPRVITPEELGDQAGYDVFDLTFFADGVIADDDDRKIEDWEEKIGTDAIGRFGEYEQDSVFVRNDTLKCDYELVKDLRNYSDVIKTRPHDLNDPNY